ncbi:MAG TPA: hypothetical protein VHS59_13950 [Bacillota bacterium]|nr:hypothetical protein [Bacillota bacterium]
MDNNLACKLCFNCVRNCPNGAVQVNLRVPARDVWHMVRVNQGFAVLIGVALGILLPVAYFRPLQHTLPTEQWRLLFSLWYWGSGVVAGGLTWLLVRPFSTKAASKRVKSMFALIPIILSCYVIYQLNYLPGVGRLFLGLNWLGSDGISHPLSISVLHLIQVIAGSIGVIFSVSALLIVAGYKKESMS